MREEITIERKKNDTLMIVTFVSLALALVSTLTYLIYTFVAGTQLIDHIVSVVSVTLLVIFAIFLVVTGFFIENKKAKIFIIVASLLLSFYSIFQVAANASQKKDLVPDFTNYDIKDVSKWAKERNISILETYEFSDTIPKYHVISQNVKKKTPVKKIKELKLVISNGVDKTITTDVTNMVGWKLDDIIKFVDDNKLTNVTINFEYSDTVDKDIIISQDVIKEISRNDPVTLVSSLGKEGSLKSVTLDNLVGLDLFHATIYLKRNAIKYNVVYEYNSDKDDTVLAQSLKELTVISRSRNQELTLTVAKANQVTVPDFKYMTEAEIKDWANDNHIQIDFSYEYDESVKEDKVISFTAVVGSTIDVDSTIKVIISKGQIRMIEFKNVAEFEQWAKENEIPYSISYEYSDTVSQGKLISTSHKVNQIIKNNETVKLVISEGGNTTVPNFIGLDMNTAKSKCKQANLTCTFEGTGNVIKQQMKAGSTVPVNTEIKLTLG